MAATVLKEELRTRLGATLPVTTTWPARGVVIAVSSTRDVPEWRASGAGDARGGARDAVSASGGSVSGSGRARTAGGGLSRRRAADAGAADDLDSRRRSARHALRRRRAAARAALESRVPASARGGERRGGVPADLDVATAPRMRSAGISSDTGSIRIRMTAGTAVIRAATSASWRCSARTASRTSLSGHARQPAVHAAARSR